MAHTTSDIVKSAYNEKILTRRHSKLFRLEAGRVSVIRQLFVNLMNHRRMASHEDDMTEQALIYFSVGIALRHPKVDWEGVGRNSCSFWVKNIN